jgi:hypothetical protein
VTNLPALAGPYFVVTNTFPDSSRVFRLHSQSLPIFTVAVSTLPGSGGTVSGGGVFVSNSTITVMAAANNGYAFVNWTTNGIVASTSPNYTFTLSNNVALVANFAALAPPLLFITRSNSVTFLYWSNSVNGFKLETTTTLTAANWAVVTNVPAQVGGFFTVSNAWPDQTRFFRLHSP